LNMALQFFVRVQQFVAFLHCSIENPLAPFAKRKVHIGRKVGWCSHKENR
jgi:hypothetical protein